MHREYREVSLFAQGKLALKKISARFCRNRLRHQPGQRRSGGRCLPRQAGQEQRGGQRIIQCTMGAATVWRAMQRSQGRQFIRKRKSLRQINELIIR